MLIVILTLALCLLVASVLFVAMFVDVAFAGQVAEPHSAWETSSWKTPLLTGRSLLDWMSNAAETFTVKRLGQRQSAATAFELADMIHGGAGTAIDQPWQKSNPKGAAGCPAYSRSMISVTPPEALRIADYLRNSLPQEAVAIRTRADRNVASTSGMDRDQYRAAETRCPLMDSDNACLAYPVRPLRCRGWVDMPLKSSSTKTCGGKCGSCSSKGASLDSHEFESRAQLVTEGVEQGFVRALKKRGLDGNLYELNSALSTALRDPHAAERWIRGENVFGECRNSP